MLFSHHRLQIEHPQGNIFEDNHLEEFIERINKNRLVFQCLPLIHNQQSMYQDKTTKQCKTLINLLDVLYQHIEQIHFSKKFFFKLAKTFRIGKTKT